MITEVNVGDLLEYSDGHSRQYLCVVISSYKDGLDRKSFDVVWITDEANVKLFGQKHYVLSTINKKHVKWRKIT